MGIGMKRAIKSVRIEMLPFHRPTANMRERQIVTLSSTFTLLVPAGIHEAPTKAAMARYCNNVVTSVTQHVIRTHRFMPKSRM